MKRDEFDLGHGGFPWQCIPSGLATALLAAAIVLSAAASGLAGGALGFA